MENFRKILKLEKDLLNLTEQAEEDIKSAGRMRSDNIEINYFVFLSFAVRFFVTRCKFLLKIISSDMFAEKEKVISRVFYRAFIEIILKIEYAKQKKIKFVRSNLWDQLKVGLFSGAKDKQISETVESYYNNLQKIDSNIPELKKIIKGYFELQNNLLEGKKDSDFIKVDKKFSFPQTRDLMEYWPDKQKPLDNKNNVYALYRILSNQIHGNVLYERHPGGAINFQLLSLLVMFNVKFLNSLMSELQIETQAKVNTIVTDIQKNNSEFIASWKKKILVKTDSF